MAKYGRQKEINEKRRPKQGKSRGICFLLLLLLLLAAAGGSLLLRYQTSRTAYSLRQDEIYAYLREGLGYSNAAASGVMANLEAESKFNSASLQDSRESVLGYNDSTYTAAVDDGSYSREEFINDASGYGLCQWTYHTRKEKLYDFARERGVSISDYQMQLDFMNRELTGKKLDYLCGLPDTIDGAYEAGYYYCEAFEKPDNPDAPIGRGNKARSYYEHYAPLYPDTEGGEAEAADGENYEVTASNLTVRSGPGTDYSKLGIYAQGTQIHILEKADGWGRINYHGQTGWVSLEYVTRKEGE